MKYTSAEAAKLLRKMNEEHSNLLNEESMAREFVASVDEKLEDVRPAYDYMAMQEKLAALEQNIRTLKHAINTFNTTTEVPGTGMTVDQILIYIPQLTAAKNKLSGMQSRLPKQRESASSFGINSSVIDYRYMNYDVARAKADYEKISDELAKIQTALDLINSTAVMELDL